MKNKNKDVTNLNYHLKDNKNIIKKYYKLANSEKYRTAYKFSTGFVFSALAFGSISLGGLTVNDSSTLNMYFKIMGGFGILLYVGGHYSSKHLDLEANRDKNINKIKKVKKQIIERNLPEDILKIEDKKIQYEISSKYKDYLKGIKGLDYIEMFEGKLEKISEDTSNKETYADFVRSLKELKYSKYIAKKLKYSAFNLMICELSDKIDTSFSLLDIYCNSPEIVAVDDVSLEFLKDTTVKINEINEQTKKFLLLKYPVGFKDKDMFEAEHQEAQYRKKHDINYLKIKEAKALKRKKQADIIKLEKIKEDIKVI